MSEREEQGVIIWSAPEPFPAVRQKSRRGIRVTTAAAMALGLAVSGGAVAGATPPSSASSTAGSSAARPPMGGAPPVAFGTVKAVGDGTFTITARDGTTVTVNVSSATTYHNGAITSPTIADVTVGEHVAVFGTDTSNVVTAISVAIGGPGAGGPCGRPGGPGGGPGRELGGPPPAMPASSSS